MVRGLAKALVGLILLVSCARAQEPALLPLPKQVEYTGGSVKADTPVTETLVEAIPEATLNENEAYRLDRGDYAAGVVERAADAPAASRFSRRPEASSE